MASQDEPRGPKATPLDRFLRLFSEVHAGEGRTAVLLLVNLFLVLVAYYLLKTVREPLVRISGGAELRAYAAAMQAGVLMGFVPLYGLIGRRVSRARLTVGVTAFFLACVELFFVATWFEAPGVGVVFFVWVGIFSTAIIAQFWSYANDVYDKSTGERLFPIIGIGATAGSVAGSYGAKLLFDHGLGVLTLLQLAAAILLVQLLLFGVIFRSPEARAAGGSQSTGPRLAGAGGFTLVLTKPYLRLIAVLLILLNLVNTTGEYILNKSVGELAEAAFAAQSAVDASLEWEAFERRYFGSFYGEFFTWVNVAGVLIQAFVVSRIVKYTGMAGVLFALPVVALGAYSLAAAGVAFSIFRAAKTAENATDYSVMNTAKAMLWLPTTPDEKYKAKQAVDTFFVRLGDVLSAGLVFAGTEWLAFNKQAFGLTNVVIILVWLGVAWLLYRSYQEAKPDDEGDDEALEAAPA